MSDFARLHDRLAKLRQRERAQGERRKLKGSGGDALLAALVTEIDETILPRRLSFETPGGTVHIAAGNRRLQALLAPAPENVPDGLAGHAMPDIEDPKLAELGAALKALFDGADGVQILSSRLKEPFASDIGVPAEQLPRVWNVAEPAAAAEPAEILESFLSGLDDSSVAWLRIEGEEVVGQGGPEAAVGALGEQAAIFLDGYFSKFDIAFREPSLACGTLISPGEAGDSSLFFVEVGDLSAILTAPPDKMLGVATAWQRLVAE